MSPARRRRAALWTAALTSLLVLAGLAGADPSLAGRLGTVTGSTWAAGQPRSVPAVTPDEKRAVVTLTGISPAVLDGRDTTKISGTLTAPKSTALVGNRVKVVLGAASLTFRGDIDTWAKGTGRANGRVLAEETGRDVPAGGTIPFTVTIEESQVGSGAAFAALPVAVEAYSRGATEPIGVTRSFLAWNPRVEYEPLQVAMAVPMTLGPEMELFSQDQNLRRQAWEEAIGPGSRLDRIVEGTKGSAVTLAVDPSVLVAGPDELEEGQDGTPAAGSPLVDRLAGELAGRDLWALPYADADLAATADVDTGNAVVRDLVDRASSVGTRIGAPVRGDIAWPADGLMPNGREKAVQSLFATSATRKATAIVVNQRAITADSPYTPTARRVAAGRTRLLGYDPRLSALLPIRSDETPVLRAQRFLAETLVLLGERPGTARSVLLAAPRNYDPDAKALADFLGTLQSIPWLKPVHADALLADDGPDRALAQQRVAKAPASAAPKPTLTELRLRQLADQRRTVDAVATVVTERVNFERTYGELLDELASVRWRYRPEDWSALNNAVSADVRDATSAIKVVRRRINFLAENGNLRITLENGLGYAVKDLRLVVAPLNPRLQVVEQPGPITIAAGPGARRNINVPVRAVAAGRADVLAYLTTADGTRIGSGAQIPITANPLDSTFYWIGGILAGLVLLAGVVRTLVKGTSRIDEIGDLDTVAQRDEAAQNRNRD